MQQASKQTMKETNKDTNGMNLLQQTSVQYDFHHRHRHRHRHRHDDETRNSFIGVVEEVEDDVAVSMMIDDLSIVSMPISQFGVRNNRRSSLMEAINEVLFFQAWEGGGDNDCDENDIMKPDANILQQQRKERHHEHLTSTLALCSSLFTMIFILSSLFPYSGLMVMELLSSSSSSNGTSVTKETVGIYAGVLTSAFMIGRASSAVLWGHLSDIYGRKLCLYVGSISNAIGSLAFGLCTASFWGAFIIRFFMGFLNGTMVVSRTMISELSDGDKNLESKGVGLLMSMIGYGTLIAPVIGGCLATPIENHPQLPSILPPSVTEMLESYPFLLPNLICCAFSIMTFFLTASFVPETLPDDQLRHWTNVGVDTVQWSLSKLGVHKEQDDDTLSTFSSSSSSSCYVSESTSLLAYSDDDDNDFIDDGYGGCDGSPNSRSRIETQNISGNGKRESNHPLSALWEQRRPMALLQVISTYWFYTFVSVAQSECFPLFAMSTVGGLAMTTSSIGLVGTLAGAFYCIFQYSTFQFSVNRLGTLRTMQFSAFVAGAIVILYPFGRYLSSAAQISILGLVMGIDMVAGSVFIGANTMEVNKLVTNPSSRGKVNGVASMGTSIGRALGPIMAGSLTTYFMDPSTYRNNPGIASYGGWFVYSSLLVIGLLAFVPTLFIDDSEGDENVEQGPAFDAVPTETPDTLKV